MFIGRLPWRDATSASPPGRLETPDGKVGDDSDVGKAGVDFNWAHCIVVVDANEQALEDARDAGYAYLPGDAASNDVLSALGIDRAAGLIACADSDVQNVYVTLTARTVNPSLNIIARAAYSDAEPKLYNAGADHVISPYVMAGRQIAADAKLPQIYRRDAASEAPVLLARGLIKRFGGIHAVDGIDLAVKDRTLHALIGPNGAGKTTAFNLLSGLFPPDAGQIELAGRSIAGLKPEDITTAGVGRSFQITNLFGGLSTKENLRLAVQAHSVKRFAIWTSADAVEDVNKQTAELVTFLGLSGMERAEAASLSYGGQRLLDMGLAIATRPRILLLDEPLAGLAATERTRS